MAQYRIEKLDPQLSDAERWGYIRNWMLAIGVDSVEVRRDGANVVLVVWYGTHCNLTVHQEI